MILLVTVCILYIVLVIECLISGYYEKLTSHLPWFNFIYSQGLSTHPAVRSDNGDRVNIVPEDLISVIKEFTQKGIRLHEGCIA